MHVSVIEALHQPNMPVEALAIMPTKFQGKQVEEVEGFERADKGRAASALPPSRRGSWQS